MRKPSTLTVTDQFCGAGGSSLGATATGAEVVLALNHWKLAVETHNTNFPNTRHDCTDISACDPRRYPSTTILITSPECTNHSLAKGRKHKMPAQPCLPGLGETPKIDPAEERSRATMFDVPRFAEFHRYELIIVENVVDAAKWVLFDEWLLMMHKLDYRWEIVYFNSMFAPPTPQSRDRMYVVFWKKGNPAPDLRFTPPAYCLRCDKRVEAVQFWKQPAARPWGRYGKRGQYVYCCPCCAKEVVPFHYAAMHAIDWGLPIARIGERKKPLKEKTLRRIEIGLRKFERAFLTQVNKTSDHCRALVEALPTPTGDNGLALVSPFLVSLSHGSDAGRVTLTQNPMQTQTTRQDQALVVPSSIERYRTGGARSVEEPLATVVAGGNHHGLLIPAMMDLTGEYRSRPITAPMSTVVAQGNHHGLLLAPLVSPSFLMPYYGTGAMREVTEAVGTITTLDRHALVTAAQPPIRVEECYFRMLQPAEIGRAMAFPESYIVLGNARERVRQYGNAVTPPVMQMLLQRCVATLQ